MFSIPLGKKSELGVKRPISLHLHIVVFIALVNCLQRLMSPFYCIGKLLAKTYVSISCHQDRKQQSVCLM